MSFDKIAEERIREAMANGEFDDLPGKGKPIDLDAYFATPAHLRLGYSVLKSSGFVPEEILLLKEVESLREELDGCPNEARQRQLKREINDKLLKFDLLKEHYKRRRPST